MAQVWADIQALNPTEPERELISACKRGKTCNLGDDRPADTSPADASPERTIRAEILRYLILGGCADCPVHEFGVRLSGAYIKGELDLSFAAARGSTALIACRFEKPVSAMQARFAALILSGSVLPGLNAQGAEVKGGVFLDGDFTAKGEVSLFGVVIGVQLSCSGGTFDNPQGFALNAEGVEVKGDVFLDGGFTAKGEVSLSGSIIGGQLSCSDGTFENLQGPALNAEGAEVNGGIFLNKVNIQAGVFSLIEAYTRVLVDDPENWPSKGKLMLDGFTYDRIHSVTDSSQRLKWLARSVMSEGEFRPQPYTQLAQVLRRMGHNREAQDVMAERERLIRKYARRRAIITTSDGTCCRCLRRTRGWLAYPFAWLLDYLLRLVVGYGYKPFRSLWALMALWGIAAALGYYAWQAGAVVPNSSVILTSPGWQELAQLSNPAAEWVKAGAAGQDWETFNPIAWGFDVVVPIPLWQTEAWAPSPIRGVYGSLAWWGRWMLAVSGWVVAALAAAAFTGIIRRD